MVDTGPTPKGPEPWEIPPTVSTTHFVLTLDGRQIPLRYTEIKEKDGNRMLIEVWPHYPHSYNQAVFHYSLEP